MTRRLTVVSVAYPLAPVGPDSVGGAEQMLHRLDMALVAAGHRSVVIARADSRVAGKLVPIPVLSGEITEAVRAAAHEAVREALRHVTGDIVHMHGIDFADYLPPPGPPVLATLHLPPGWYPPQALSPGRPDTWVHCVSASQHAACPPSARLLPPIPNGVPVAALQRARHARRSFALMLGRICPEKGQHHALEAAHLADVPLLIAGEAFAYPAHERYLREEVLPRLDARRRLIGPVGFARKRRLLSAARCLLVPSGAPETSSLVAMEAIACGTPVIAFQVGALPEILSFPPPLEGGAGGGVKLRSPQETSRFTPHPDPLPQAEREKLGFLVTTPTEMAAAISRTHELDPEHARATARARFSLDRCTAAYLSRYAELAAIHVA